MPDIESLPELAFQAEGGDTQAKYRLGVLFLLGQRVEQDLDAARRWFQAAASSGSNGAEALLARICGAPTAPAIAQRRNPFWAAVFPLLLLVGLSTHLGYQFIRTIQAPPSSHLQVRLATQSPSVARAADAPLATVATVKKPFLPAAPGVQRSSSREAAFLGHHRSRARKSQGR